MTAKIQAGSPEAYAWARKMAKARKIRRRGKIAEQSFFGKGRAHHRRFGMGMAPKIDKGEIQVPNLRKTMEIPDGEIPIERIIIPPVDPSAGQRGLPA